MAYKYETQYNSPNYTPESQVYATWGRGRTIEAIAIHWWGDPNQGPTYEGVISTLCNPSRGASAHFVATGTGRRVAQLVNFNDASWATNSANPYTLSIECDPRCRNEDYDVVAELIAQIRQVYGNLPLVPHRQFIATACPGNYDLNRLNAIAATKIARPEDDWGVVSNKPTGPVKVAVPGFQKLPEGYVWLKAKIDKVELWDLDSNPNYQSKKTFNKGDIIKVSHYIDFNNTRYYVSDYSVSNGFKWGINRADVDVLLKDPSLPGNQLPATPTQPPAGNTGTNPTPTPKPEVPKQETVKLDTESTTLLQDVSKLLKELITLLKNIFNRG